MKPAPTQVSFRRLQMKSIPCWWCGEPMWLESPEHLECSECDATARVDSLTENDRSLVHDALEWMNGLA